MDLKLIKSLLGMISESDVNEVSIEEGDFKIMIKKSADVTNNYHGGAPQYISAPMPMATPAAPVAPATTAPAPVAAEAKPAASNQITIKSPMVGTFYRSPNPDAPSFVSVGDTIAKGDTICIIEAMKIMNEVTADHSGKIVKILVENAQPIEFDQPLFLIEPA